MDGSNDDAQNFALMALAGVVALVIAGVIGLAIFVAGDTGTPPAAAALAAEIGVSDARIVFDPRSERLPDGATAEVARIAEAARGDAGRIVLISAFSPAASSPAEAEAAAEAAMRRALAVRHALEADGVPVERLVLDRPQTGADVATAHRVEMRLR